MPYKNKTLIESVPDDDDLTTELEMLRTHHDFTDFDSDPQVRTEFIDRLQFDTERLRARWLGLETEDENREDPPINVNGNSKSNERVVESKATRLQQRDSTIKSLNGEIRKRDNRIRDLQDLINDIRLAKQELETGDAIDLALQQLSVTTGQLASNDAALRDLQAQQRRTEDYADQLRRQLSDLSGDATRAVHERDALQNSFAVSEQKVEKLTALLERANGTISETTNALDEAERAREAEIRVLRFELGEAEETLSENVHISEQLASDLIDTRSFRDELERMLNENEEESDGRINGLRREVSKLEKTIGDNEDKLETRSEAINSLMTELAKKSYKNDSIEDIEVAIQEMGGERQEIGEHRARDKDGITRLLIGQFDDQELRFPLFKSRLTIGRTTDNDIQLKADYISRRHAFITTEGDAAKVVDWGSRNGVYVNSKRVSEHFLQHGDIVSIGIAKFRYEELSTRDS